MVLSLLFGCIAFSQTVPQNSAVQKDNTQRKENAAKADRYIIDSKKVIADSSSFKKGVNSESAATSVSAKKKKKHKRNF